MPRGTSLPSLGSGTKTSSSSPCSSNSSWIAGSSCTTLVCKIAEGILTELDITLTNFAPCKEDLDKAEQEFTAAVSNFAQGNLEWGARYMGRGLNMLSLGVDACGLKQQLQFIVQEANVFGLGNGTWIDTTGELVIHGADVYNEVYSAVNEFALGDYRAAG